MSERDPTIEIEKEIYDELKKKAEESRRKLKPFVNDLLLDFLKRGSVSGGSKPIEDQILKMKKDLENLSLLNASLIWKERQKSGVNIKNESPLDVIRMIDSVTEQIDQKILEAEKRNDANAVIQIEALKKIKFQITFQLSRSKNIDNWLNAQFGKIITDETYQPKK